jgi:hypothetical protein
MVEALGVFMEEVKFALITQGWLYSKKLALVRGREAATLWLDKFVRSYPCVA